MLYVIAAKFRKLPETEIKVLCELIVFWMSWIAKRVAAFPRRGPLSWWVVTGHAARNLMRDLTAGPGFAQHYFVVPQFPACVGVAVRIRTAHLQHASLALALGQRIGADGLRGMQRWPARSGLSMPSGENGNRRRCGSGD